MRRIEVGPRLLGAAALLLILLPLPAVAGLQAGFGTADVTPKLGGERPVYLAGLASNRAATGVHDRLYARAVVLGDGERRMALVSVDSIGLPYPLIQAARRQLDDLDFVLVASTHSHSSPDVVGIWGPAADTSGVDPAYNRRVVKGIVQAVRGAERKLVPVRAKFGTAEDETLLGDFRLPEVYDGVLRALKFVRSDNGQPCGIVVQWNSHGVEPRDSFVVSRDFMGSTVDALEKRHDCPVIYFQGAIGGLMGTPKKLIEAAKAGKISTEPFEFIDACGEAVADLADRALEGAKPIELAPLRAFARPIAIPLDNDGFRAAVAGGVLKRPVFAWSDNRNRLGKPLSDAKAEGPVALRTEVAYLQLGELHVAAIPGELYPECVYGKYQDPVDPGADFPDAPLERPIAKILPADKMLVLGLAGDEVGYIIPKRQWDVKPPFAYDRTSAQYGERNSVGPETAEQLLAALADRVKEAKRAESGGDKKPTAEKKAQQAARRAKVAAAAKRRARAGNPALAAIEDDPSLPRVLLIGDSISIGYTLPVRELLQGKANVHRIGTNGGPTTNGLAHLDEWLGKGKWDVIHFNWGLHDLKYISDNGSAPVDPNKGHQQVPPEAYEQNLRKLVERLKQTGAKLIWCSTTPVPDGAAGRIAQDEVQYNALAAEIMDKNGVEIDDLYAFARPRLEETQRPKNVHFTPEGSAALAEQVSRSIQQALDE